MEQYLLILQKALLMPYNAISWTFQGTPPEITLKLLFLFLPLTFILVSTWISTISIGTLLFRVKRTQYIATVLINWWDGSRAIFTYWAGILRFAFLSLGWFYGATRLMIMGAFQTIKDIIFSPLTILTNMAKGYAKPGIPWVAVMITFIWIALEASIFTFVLSPLIHDILTGMTNQQLPSFIVSIGVYVFLFMIVGGSLACMYALVEAIEKKDPAMIVKMTIIEIVVMMVEVVFFYREFVEAIIPFFNRMTSDDLILGPGVILAIGVFAWLGVRSSTWFFFGKYGTPTLLMIMAREGIESSNNRKEINFIGQPLEWIKALTGKLQNEINWFSLKGQEMMEAATLPPIQLLAVITNFAMCLLTGKNLFNLPVRSLEELKDSKELVEQISIDLKEA